MGNILSRRYTATRTTSARSRLAIRQPDARAAISCVCCACIVVCVSCVCEFVCWGFSRMNALEPMLFGRAVPVCDNAARRDMLLVVRPLRCVAGC